MTQGCYCDPFLVVIAGPLFFVIASEAWQSRRGMGLRSLFRVKRGISLRPGFCSCLIHQAQLPNKLGNYNVKKSKIKGSQQSAVS